ncbi:hypothetical protein UFOVP968_24 [uncultured Caudovirales phage]|uniref:Uncharacterized protein n=1 Tax=uncultured Caudovirales phage TaxID=2100421 RepID=A0A6J5PXJ6_9CAUD|nr:hypothetical protein UFOVP968_24 [uncultured Caudovirales phage]CAB4186014.1 hypothetical protein UFOVP1133_4 [uncultured Caudovirales phage]CAB4192402.1 hypothetical protein UFOVP1249_21 [uncultured Caudovirales phage]CAB4217135.1 hypothetical protein UFOVP1494_13 [uncultured Caudovirales phage]CAB5231079.1 hypothetical protein UFOVP1583_21 [uncultured Caudovirales phage]
MSVLLNNDVYFKIGATSATAVNLSSRVSQVQIVREYDEVETTALGAVGHARIAGLSNDSYVVTFYQDHASALVNQTIEPLLGTATIYIEAFPTGAAAAAGGTPPTASATNPKYSSATVFLGSWTPISGGVADLATIDVTFKVNGQIAKATS